MERASGEVAAPNGLLGRVWGALTRRPHAAGTSQHRAAHDFTFDSIDGEPLPLAAYRGRALLVVNTASQCGFTAQYVALQHLFERYGARGLTVIGVPSNDFGSQEPGSEAQIRAFCESRFGITFPLTAKTMVKGTGAHPFYRWAADQFGPAARPRWNFHKYLAAPDGKLTDWFSTVTGPTSTRVIEAIERVLPD